RPRFSMAAMPMGPSIRASIVKPASVEVAIEAKVAPALGVRVYRQALLAPVTRLAIVAAPRAAKVLLPGKAGRIAADLGELGLDVGAEGHGAGFTIR